MLRSKYSESPGRGFFIALLFVCSLAAAQDLDHLFDRLQGITQGDVSIFNTDGVDIAVQKINGEFTPSSISKNFKFFRLKETEITASDSEISRENYFVSTRVSNEYSYYYFFRHDDKVLGIGFGSPFEIDRQFQRHFVTLVLEEKIPKEVYSPLKLDKAFNFAGREVPVENCKLLELNKISCAFEGKMTWSSFSSAALAQRSMDHEFDYLSSQGKVIVDEMVDVLFEGQETKARRIVLDFTNATTQLAAGSYGRTLTAYIASAPVRNKFLMCVISGWNGENSDPRSLSYPGREVMQLK